MTLYSFKSKHYSIFTALFMAVQLSIAKAEVELFTQLSLPAGVTTDSEGNVYVHSDAVSTTYLTKFSPAGEILSRITLGGINISEFIGSRMTRIPGTDFMLLLTPQGVIYYFTPEFNGGVLADLRDNIGQVANDVYDVLRQDFRPLNLGLPNYGDITSRWRSNSELEILVAATTGAAGGFHFITRIRYDVESGEQNSKVIVTSQGTTAGTVDLPPGVAVNDQGTVLTTLPFTLTTTDGTGIGFTDSLVSFNTDFPETMSGLPQFILQDPNTSTGLVDFASSGMEVDAFGNFYIATGVTGTSVCAPASSGAVVFIDASLSQLTCTAVGDATLLRTSDVAVSHADNTVYVTIGEYSGSVLRLGPIVPQEQ